MKKSKLNYLEDSNRYVCRTCQKIIVGKLFTLSGKHATFIITDKNNDFKGVLQILEKEAIITCQQCINKVAIKYRKSIKSKVNVNE